jgi:anaphase-promoting complex subunit 6
VSRAENFFYRNEFSKCLELTSRVLNEDPHNYSSRLISLHISSLLELGMKNQLFYFAHKLVNDNPEMAVSWYAVGCYYFLVGKNQQARRHFSKSTSLQAQFGPSWIGFGHAFAADSEHDQAMAAYRTAERILKGCHLPNLYIGMELIRVNNFTHALSCVRPPLFVEFLSILTSTLVEDRAGDL